MIYRITKDNITLDYLTGNGITKVFGKGNISAALSGAEEFVLFIYAQDTGLRMLNSSQMAASAECCGNELAVRYTHDGIEARVTYSISKYGLIKSVSVKSEKPCTLRRIVTECSGARLPLTHGGEGQPVFIGNSMWCAMENPVAQNLHSRGVLNFIQAPFLDIYKQQFTSFDIAFGFTGPRGSEASFAQYIEDTTIKNAGPVKIYCDWGLHDELSDGVNLDEKMSLDVVDMLTDFIKNHDTKFDYYLMDAFWYENNKPYIDFKKATFPNGQRALLEKLSAADIKYGMWFDVNFIHAKLKGMDKYKRLPDVSALCFACPDIADLMEKALLHHIRESGIRLIKFDFAFFDCCNPEHSDIHSTVLRESKEVSVRRFTEMIGRLRLAQPELVIIAYNGFTVSLESIGSVKKRDYSVVSPYWARCIDYIYCGDPRPSEIAANEFSDSLIYYTDAMIEQFSDSFMPLKNIDDHGTMLGNTGTIYWEGKRGLQKNLMMSIMRGSRKLHLYGDLGLLDNADKGYISFIHGVYSEIIDKQMVTERILGSAVSGEVYGYHTHDSLSGYIAVVNPRSVAQAAVLSPKQWETDNCIRAKVVFRNVCCLENISINGKTVLSLAPHSVTVLKWQFADKISGKHLVHTTLDAHSKLALSLKPDTARVHISFYDENRDFMRTVNGRPEGFSAKNSRGETLPWRDKPVWSGISWMVANAEAGVVLENNGAKPLEIAWEECAE